MSVPVRRAVIRRWLALHRSADPAELLAVVGTMLTEGDTYEEQTAGGEVLRSRVDVRALVEPRRLEEWLEHQVGWAEVDSLCQSTFPAEQILARWADWEALIRRLSESDNINQRRSALVLLTGPVTHSGDPRLSDLAFAVIDRLAPERSILITRAVSWLMRCLVKTHREEVETYLERKGAELPSIAARETRTLLATGTKSGRSRRG
jgi:3-methyladenine DNA glycosylase AlkD